MAEPITLGKLVDANIDADTLGEFANEDKTVVSRKGLEYPSAAMASRLTVENGLLGATPFSTYAAMVASALVDGNYAIVTNDETSTSNGVYQKIDGAWVYSDYNPVSQAENVVYSAQKNLKSVFLEKGFSLSGNYIFAVTDSVGNETWLQANSEDGGLTDVSESAIRDRLNIDDKSKVSGVFNLTDAVGNLTDLQLDENGEIHQDVIERWSHRLGVIPSDSSDYVPQLKDKLYRDFDAGFLINGDTYLKNGMLFPVHSNPNKVVFVGSSSLHESVSSIRAEMLKINANFEFAPLAFGGAKMTHMETMLGITPLALRFVDNKIPSSGDASATIINGLSLYSSNRMDMTGYVNGILGNIKQGVGSGQVVFTRTNSGSEVTVADGVEFIPELGCKYRDAMQILWIGKNNLVNEDEAINNVDDLLLDTDSIINYSVNMQKRVILLTHFVNTGVSADAPERTRINECNQRYKDKYGAMVFDINPIILGEQIFIDLGITRTADDVLQQSVGNKPGSLSRDYAHLSPVVNQYIAEKLAAFIQSKNWY